MQRMAIGFRKNGHRPDAKLFAGANDPKSDLPTVGDKNFIEHQRGLTANKFSPYSTGCPFWTRMSTISPETSDSISFISFMASMIQTGIPFCTKSPIETY